MVLFLDDLMTDDDPLAETLEVASRKS